ncbi:uncharacterized protein LOC113387748 [Ctenocephalides felis]|uniref:uncharacterized protein LOC113387748 n=1 Tax=Ctenocephalides felis TaxID=7515 RepID=UPI000E6E4273|nr:uncharacterized protein LOC113387748 [Ctenocephalides felis]
MEAGPAPEPDVDVDQPDGDQAEVIDDSDTDDVRPSEIFQQTAFNPDYEHTYGRRTFVEITNPDEMAATYTIGQSGTRQLIYRKYKYNLNTTRQSERKKSYWVCSFASRFKCRATIHTLDHKIIRISKTHNHEPILKRNIKYV